MEHRHSQNNLGQHTSLSGVVQGSNQSSMRAHNERLVLTLLRQFGPMPKAEIARATGLSAQTVSVIMRALEADGLLEKGPPMRGKVGQPSVPMNLSKDGAFFIGLKVGRRSLDMLLIDFVGNVRGRRHLSHSYPTPDIVVRFANDAIADFLGQLTPDQGRRVAGLGIALPFRMWDWAIASGAASLELANWRDRDIASDLASYWDFPIYLGNDATAACGAELVFGNQDKPRNFLYFFLGFFAGGGLVLDNALYTGPNGNAAALGSIPVGINGNKLAQLVDVASLATLETLLQKRGLDSGRIWQNSERWTVPTDVVDTWMAAAVEGLAFAILSSTCLIDIDCVIIDGWLPEDIRTGIVDRTTVRLADIHAAGIDRPKIHPGSIGCDARSLGAASLPLSDRFLVDRKTSMKG